MLVTEKVSIDYVYVNSDASKNSKLWDDLVYELNDADNAGCLSSKLD